jgi:hypothetical protein
MLDIGDKGPNEKPEWLSYENITLKGNINLEKNDEAFFT